MIMIHPRTRQRIVLDRRSNDINFDLVGDTSISQETVPLIGPWVDFTGSAFVNSRSQQQHAGRSNQLEGQDPGIEGDKVPSLNEVGQRSETTRRRTIKENMSVAQWNAMTSRNRRDN